MVKKHTFKALLSTLIILLVSTNSAITMAAADDETWYQIEVIIAQRTDTKTHLEKFESQPPAPAKWQKGRQLYSFDNQNGNRHSLENTEFISLPIDQKMLNNEVRKLSNTGNIEVLVHQSWRQILRSNKAINWVEIKKYDALNEHQQLEGSLGFSKGRYLHIHSNIHLNQFPTVNPLFPPTLFISNSDHATQTLPSAGESLVPIVETRYSLIQRRKMRSHELHYLDHPKLMLLVKIIPFTPADPIVETNL